MELWQRLLSIRAENETTFRSFEVSLRDVRSLVFTLLTTILLGGLIVSLYWFQQERMTTRRRLWLVGLRLIAVFILSILVFRPIHLVAVMEGERPRSVVLLLDNTQSMLRHDERHTTEDLLRVALANNLISPNADVTDKKLLTGLTEQLATPLSRLDMVFAVFRNPRLNLNKVLTTLGPLHRYSFSYQPKKLSAKVNVSLQQTLTGQGKRTALADSLHDLLLKGDVDLPAAVIVVTDGCDNDSTKDLHRLAEQYREVGVPLHIYGVGSTQGETLELIEAKIPDVLFAGDTVGIPIRWKATGTSQKKIRLSIKLGDKELTTKEVAFQEGDDLRETITFLPTKEGDQPRVENLQVKIESIGRPDLTESVSQAVRIVNSRIKVLYIENLPRWEYKFIQRALLRDKRVEARFLLMEADEETLNSGVPYLKEFPKSREALLEHDLIIVGDVRASDLRGKRLEWLEEFVKEGGGLVHLAGPLHAPAEFIGTSLEEMLPVEIRAQRFARSLEARTEGFQPRLTRYGRRSDLLYLDDDPQKNLQIWEELPSLFWSYPVEKLSPGAIALLEHPTMKADKEPMPLLALHRYGKGQVLFVGFSETWRWRFNEGETLHNRFWGQIVYQIGMRDAGGNKQSQLALDRARVYLGEEARLFAHLVDEDFRPVVKESINVNLEQINGPNNERKSIKQELHPIPGVPGEYHTLLANNKSGTFLAKIEEQGIQFEYRVEVPPNHELASQGLNEASLRDAATASGGSFYREEDLHRLGESIHPKTLTYQVRPPVPLLNPLTFLMFLGILTAEWILRKVSNLS